MNAVDALSPRGGPSAGGGRLRRALPLIERNLTAYRHGWMAMLSGFFEPVFYLFSLGVGLGDLIGTVGYGDQRVDYIAFVAPALLASSAMNGAIYDSAFNIFFKLKYAKLYDSVLATPLGPRDVALGEVCWALGRGLLYATAFLAVMAVTGTVRSWWALLALPVAVLVGFAFAGAGAAAASFMRSWQDFDLVQLAIVPLFLFSATFYPVETYPGPLQLVVRATPLYQGVELMRALSLGQAGWGLCWHGLYLVVMGAVGMYVASWRLGRLLQP